MRTSRCTAGALHRKALGAAISLSALLFWYATRAVTAEPGL
jgi:hypothetical protein